MEKKCLVTKLKVSVQNDSLPILGELRVNKTSTDEGFFSIRMSSSETIKIIGDGYFTDSTYTENKGKTLNIEANKTISLYLSKGLFYVSIPNRYNIIILNKDTNDPLYTGTVNNIDSFKYCSKLKFLAWMNGLSGNLNLTQEIADTLLVINTLRGKQILSTTKILGSIKTLESFQIGGTGTLMDLFSVDGGRTNFSDIRFELGKVTGEIADFGKKMVELGRTSGSTTFRTNKIMTLNGLAQKNSTKLLFNWQSSTSFEIIDTTNSKTYQYQKTEDIWSYTEI